MDIEDNQRAGSHRWRRHQVRGRPTADDIGKPEVTVQADLRNKCSIEA